MSTRAVIAIFKRNLFAYFGSPTGYVFICAFVLASGFAAFWPSDFFNANLANLDQLNKYIHFILLGFIPAITMSIWADERRQGTDELLLTLPASDLQVVIGKYLAAVAIFTVSLVFSLTNIIVLKWLGDPDMGLLFSTYLGYWFMGLAMLSVGMVASFLTGNLTVAFVMGVAFNVPLVMAGHTDLIVSSASLTESFRGWSLHAHFNDFARGIVSLSSIIYFGVIIGAMLYFCSVLIGRRHWSGTSSRVPLGIHYAARLASILVASISLGWLFSAHDTHSDFTSEKLSVLSPKSIELLEAIPKDRVITIKAYISPEREIPESYVQTRINLMNMLDELEKRAGGRIKVIRHTEVESFKEEATTAEERYGITEQRIFTRHRGRLQDSRIYMGLAFVGGENQQVVVPFLHRGIPVEYELMRSIVSLLDQEKKTLGIVMDADNRGVLMGGFDMRTRQPQPVHPLITELRKQYDVKVVDPAQPMQQYELRDITVNADALSATDHARAEFEALERLKKIALPGLGAAGAGIKESQWAEWKQQIDALKAEATANQGLVKLGNTNAVARAKGITNQISVTRKNLENSLNAVRQSTANSGLFHLARMHEKGWGTEANATAARQLYTQLANKLAGSSRDAEHLLKVAAAFGSGLVVMADPTEAERWYGKAVVEYTIIANQGNSPAMIKLGDLFQANRGLPPDLRAAVAAYAELSPMLKPVVEFDPLADEVARWYQNAAGQGDPVGAKRLAALHEGGNGRPRDNGEVARWRRQAVKLLRTRAEQGDAAAMHDLAVAYQRGEGVVPDPAKATEWFTEALETRRTAAEGGDAEAQFLVGKMLQFGPGPERDPAAAREWFGKAAGQGHAGAQFKLGQMHALGDAGWTDFKTAAEWYTQAAEQGHHQAQWALADLLERGEGVTRDAVAAVKWSMIANQSFEHQLLLDGETRLEVAGRKGKVLYKNYDALLSFQPSAMSPASMPHLINALRAGAPAAILEDPYVALYSRAQVPSTGDPKMGAPQGMGMPPRPSPKADITQLWSLLQIGSLSEDNRTALDRMEIEEEMWSLASGTFPDDRRQRGELGLFMRRFRPFFENVMEETQRKIQAKIRAQETTRANQPEAADRRVSRDEISLWVLEIQADLLTTTIKRLPAGSDQREIFGEALKLLQPLLMAQALKVEQAAVRRNSRRLGERAQRTRNSHIIWHTYNPFPKNDYLDSEIVFTGGTAGGTRPAFNPDHEISAGLQYLLFPFTGSLSAEANATLQFDPLVRTGPTTGLTRGSSMAGGGGRMSSTRERQSTTGAQHVLAAHIHGVPRVEATDVKSSATDLAGRLGKGLILHEKQASVLRELARIDPAAAESFGRWLEGAFSPDEISHGPLSRQMLDLRAAAAKFATALGSVDADRGVEFKALLDEANGTRLLAEDLENIAPRIAAEAALAGQRLRAEDEAAFTAFEKWNGARFWNRIDPATGKLPSPGGNATQPVDAVKILAGLEASLPEVPAGIARQWATRALQRDRFESLAHRRIRERLRGVITETLAELPKRLELLPPQQALQRLGELRVLENEFKTILGARPGELAANMAALRTTAESLVQLLDDHGLAMGLALARVKRSETPGGSSTAEPDTGPTAPWSADYAATDAFSPRINVVLAPDVDFVAPVLFQLRTEGMGTEMGMNLDVDNVTFILNTLDHLADDDRFIAIRNKRRRHRTLTRIEDRTRQGRQEIQAMREKFKEQSRQVSLSAKQDFEKQMDVLLEKNGWHSFARAEAEAEESGGILLLSMDEREEYDNYINAKKVLEEQRDAHVEREENQMKDSRDEEIKREQAGLDRAIRNEERRIKQLAVFLPPIIPLCLGLLVFLTRLRRETTGVSATRIRDV